MSEREKFFLSFLFIYLFFKEKWIKCGIFFLHIVQGQDRCQLLSLTSNIIM